MDDNVIICRCSDLTLKELRKLILEGYITLEEIKRISRAGMGPCQGQTCRQLIAKEIAILTNQNLSDIEACNSRPPTKGIPLNSIASAGEGV